MPYKFAIIGGGLTATSFLCQLVDKLRDARAGTPGRPPDLELVVFEKKDVFGPGLPHSDQYVLPFHITNMCAKDMSVRMADPDDFQDWVQNNRDVLKDQFPDLHIAFACPDCNADQCRHYPRAVMGEYLKARFAGAVRDARELGVPVDLKPGTEVTDLSERDNGILLTCREPVTRAAAHYTVDGVLLATGHWFETPENEYFFTSPWPASKLLAGIPAGETVGVIGSSLSAIEVALTLTSGGRFERQPSGELAFIPPANPRKVVFYSRRGLLPRVRGKSGRRANRYLTCDAIRQMIADNPGGLMLSDIFKLLEKELNLAYHAACNWRSLMDNSADPAEQLRRHILDARSGDGPDGELIWQTVLVEIFPVTRDLYLNLALEERKRFDRLYNTVFFMHAATQPVINAEKLLALIEGGFVSVVKLGDGYQLNREPSGRYRFVYRDEGGRERIAGHRYIVNARGQPRSIMTDQSQLTRNLLRRGIVRTEESRTVDMAPSANRTRPRDQATGRSAYKTGSVLVDPATHQVVQGDADGATRYGRPVFAVGAMTRGQMIDASMAYGIARSTAAIVDYLTDKFFRA